MRFGRLLQLVFIITTLVYFTSSALAAMPDANEIQEPAHPPEEPSDTLTGTWGGRRVKLSEKGLDIGLVYKAEFFTTLNGGLKSGWGYLDNLDLLVQLDAEKLIGWTGATFFFYGLRNNGKDPSEYVGDAQVVSNIQAPVNTSKVYEAWFQQNLFRDRVSLLVGLHDLNAEFYATESSRLFFNSSFGIGFEFAQIAGGPSIFPTTALAARLKVQPSRRTYVQAAVWDGSSGDPNNPHGTHVSFDEGDGALAVGEAGYVAGGENGQGGLYRKFAIGGWTTTRRFEHLSDVDAVTGEPVMRKARGVYVLAEQNVTEDVAFFLRYGVASPDTNEYRASVAAGAQLTGAIPKRRLDRLGLAVTSAEVSGHGEAARESAGLAVSSRETAIELTYRAEAIPGLAVQPDLQYVINPGADPTIDDALVFLMRFELSL